MSNHETAAHAPQWYVIKTQPKQESRANMNLNAWNVETFYPTLKKRGANPYRSAYTINPLFPGYLFARFRADALLHKVHYTRGVKTVVGFGEGPVSVDEEIIAALRTRVDKDGFLKLEDDLAVGDEIVIKEGPMKDLIGIFERELKPTQRVMILLRAISYQGHVTLHRSAVARAN